MRPGLSGAAPLFCAGFLLRAGAQVIRQKIEAVRLFVSDVMAEMGRSEWPERGQLIESTIVVISSVVLLSLFVGVSDKVLVTMLSLLVPSA